MREQRHITLGMQAREIVCHAEQSEASHGLAHFTWDSSVAMLPQNDMTHQIRRSLHFYLNNKKATRVPRFRPDNADIVMLPLPDFLLTTLVCKCAGSFAGGLTGRLALAAAHLFSFFLQAALQDRFDMLHTILLIRVLCSPTDPLAKRGAVITKAATRLYNMHGPFCNPNYTTQAHYFEQMPELFFMRALYENGCALFSAF